MTWLRFFSNRRRSRAANAPFPRAWENILARHFPLDSCLPEADRKELRKRIQIFVSEKHFEGLGGLELNDEIRVTIAAQACLLLLHHGEVDYPNLRSILVYPTAYQAPVMTRTPDGVVTEGVQGRLGEAWNRGVVVLSWRDVRFGAADIHDGHNVVLHEFAHALDMEDNVANGAPPLPRRSMYVAWARVLGQEYEQLRRDVAQAHRTIMDAYGTTNPAEFFAVATETFFEKPNSLKKKHPELYEQLRAYYRQDPASFVAAPD